MTGTDSYSITPATNATADGGSINWAEGQPPSSVNNSARQWMADERSSFNDLIWFQYGTGDQGAGNLAVPGVYSSGTAFTITGADVTTIYETNRRVRAVGTSTGTIYGSISSSTYSSGNTTTTVNVTWDGGATLSNETLVISLSQIPITGQPGPYPQYGTWTPVDASAASLSLSGIGRWTKIGTTVFVAVSISYPVTANGSNMLIGGLPFTATNSGGNDLNGMTLTRSTAGRNDLFSVIRNSATIIPVTNANAGIANSVYSNKFFVLSGFYTATA